MSFITVKYGENLEQIFNANCPNKVLLSYIRETCDCEDLESIDLCDENGKVKQLHRNLSDYAAKSCRNRETLVLLKVQSSEDDSAMTVYTPLVTGVKFSTDFHSNLNPRPAGKSKRRAAHSTSQDKKDAKEKVASKSKSSHRKGK